jgi:arginase
MNVRVIAVPFDSGNHETRMGRGPRQVLEAGLLERLRADMHRADAAIIAPSSPFLAEIATSIDLGRALAAEVSAAITAGGVPIVLAGNCSTALGAVAGVRDASHTDRTGVVWLDAHADFNTPETTISGFFDGTALAALTGKCWAALTATIPGFHAVAEPNVILVGARDLDAPERSLLEQSSVTRLHAHGAHLITSLRTSLEALHERVDQVYLHIDLDVIDPAVARANMFAAPNGLTTADLLAVIREVGSHIPIAAAALTAYDPDYDPDRRIPAIAIAAVGEIIRNAKCAPRRQVT